MLSQLRRISFTIELNSATSSPYRAPFPIKTPSTPEADAIVIFLCARFTSKSGKVEGATNQRSVSVVVRAIRHNPLSTSGFANETYVPLYIWVCAPHWQQVQLRRLEHANLDRVPQIDSGSRLPRATRSYGPDAWRWWVHVIEPDRYITSTRRIQTTKYWKTNHAGYGVEPA